MSTPKGLVLTGFADEASPILADQVAVFRRLGLQGIDVRSIEGVNVLDLTNEQLGAVREEAEAAGLMIQAVGSPVNKVHLSHQASVSELGKLERAVEVAKALGTKRIRIFSPEVPEGHDQLAWTEVKAWMGAQVALAEKHGMLLLHENDARFFGAFPKNARRLLAEFGGPNFKAAFDFANTVLLGYKPFPDWFPWILPYVDTLHIKDAVHGEDKIVPAGQGQGQIARTLQYMLEQGWTGTLTLEPHLQAAGPFGGYSGEALFEVATKALRDVLTQIGGQA